MRGGDFDIAKKEAKRLELLAKKAAKNVKNVVEGAVPGAKANKDASAAKEKPKKEEEVPFVNNTPAGDKKGTLY